MPWSRPVWALSRRACLAATSEWRGWLASGRPRTPAVRDPTQHHGLYIVRALASEYGIDGDQDSRTTWARFDWTE